MSFAGNIKNAGTSQSKNNYQLMKNVPPNTPPMVYRQSVFLGMRNPLPESEPMSEYSEPQLTPNRVPGMFQQQRFREGPKTPSTGPHRLMHQDTPTRASPYARTLPPPTPQCFITHYNDQAFIMQPVSPSPSPATSRKSVTFSSPLPKSKPSSSKNTNPTTTKVSSVSRTRFMIGSIEQVVRWHKAAKKAGLYTLYEVPAIIEYIAKRPNAYNIILRSEQKTLPLQAVFYPIDRDLPAVEIGQLITCVGRMVGANKLHVFDLWPTSTESLAGLKRISFLCQHSLQEAEP